MVILSQPHDVIKVISEVSWFRGLKVIYTNTNEKYPDHSLVDVF